MLSIKSRFQKASEKQRSFGCYDGGELGGYPALAVAVKGQGFTKYAISKNMNELLVLGLDYEKEDRKDLLEELYQLSNPILESEELKIEGENVNEASSDIEDVVSDEEEKKICE